MRSTSRLAVWGWGLCLLLSTASHGQTIATRNKPDWAKLTAARSAAVFTQCRDQGAQTARRDARLLLAGVSVYAPLTETHAYIDAAFTVRMVDLLAAETDKPAQLKLFDYFQKHDGLARELAFAMRAEDKPADVLKVLHKLIEAHGDKPGQYPTLTAALCVVHDQPLARRINENSAKADDVVKLFDYYVTHEKRLLFGLKVVPTDLLIWVVDTTASVEEMSWALAKYAGDRAVGKRFFDIKYDFEHLRTGRPKQISLQGFTLQNILQHGGVCADQAYFAMTVAKAIGVPSAYVTAQSGEVGHAWVGFLQHQGRGAAWNFDLGRYPEYQGLRGVIEDPQTRKPAYDGFVAVRAELIGTQSEERFAAKAFTTAAIFLSQIKEPKLIPADQAMGADAATDFGEPRENNASSLQGMLDAAMKHNPCLDEAWFYLRHLAAEGKLTLPEKKSWAEKLQRLTGKKYPDFMFAILQPMIETIDDAKEQNALWEAAFAMMTLRKDLAAEVRMAQATMWEKQDKPELAGKCYEDVINRFANDGPFVVKALDKTEQMLTKSGLSNRALQLYAQTWKRLEKPSGMAGTFAEQSNWYRVGRVYATKLREAAQESAATAVESQLKQVAGG